MSKFSDADVAASVRAECAAHRISQADLAGMFGVSVMYVSRRFRGDVAFSAAELLNIATALRVPVARLADRAKEAAADRKVSHLGDAA